MPNANLEFLAFIKRIKRIIRHVREYLHVPGDDSKSQGAVLWLPCDFTCTGAAGGVGQRAEMLWSGKIYFQNNSAAGHNGRP